MKKLLALTLAFLTAATPAFALPSFFGGRGGTISGNEVKKLTAAATVAIDFNQASVFHLTPTGDETLTASGGIPGERYSVVITTSGTTSRTITFGTGFNSTGTLATGTTNGATFVVNFVHDGSQLTEIGRSPGGGGSGSVSDTAYGSGWNGVTDTAPSKNAVYDKIETIATGSAPGNVTNLSCSDDIATKIAAATSGDTLALGSCTYSISSTIAFDKPINLVGQGPGKTVIDMGANDISAISIASAADGSGVRNLSIIASGNNAGTGIAISCADGTVCNNVTVENVVFNLTDSNAATNKNCGGISYIEAGGRVNNVDVTLVCDPDVSAQIKGVAHYNSAGTAEADTYLYFSNSRVHITSNNSASVAQVRPFFSWNNSATPSAGDLYNYLTNVTLLATVAGSSGGAGASSNDSEAFQNQGPNTAPVDGVTGGVYSYVIGGYIDGAYGNTNAQCGTSLVCENYRIDDYSEVWFYGTRFGSLGRFTSVNSGTVHKVSTILFGGGIIGDAPGQAPTSLAANALITLTGQKGGDKPGSGTQSGLNGGAVTIIGGAGGMATTTTTSGTGGAGGAFNLTAGAGGDQTNASATTNNGGAGGDFNITAGAGGNASAAATNNNGGAGGDVNLVPGAGGTGATAAGSAGYVRLATADDGTQTGKVAFGQATCSTAADFCINGGLELVSSSQGVVAGTGITTPITNGNVVSVNGSGMPVTITATPNIQDGFANQIIFVTGTSDSNTLTIQDQANLTGSGLENWGENLVLRNNDTAILWYDSGDDVWKVVVDNTRNSNLKFRRLLVNSTAVGNVVSSEDDLITYTIKGNTQEFTGDSIRVRAWGTFAANANAKTLKFYYGATTVYDSTAVNANGGSWYMEALIIRTGTATQDIIFTLNTGNTTLSATGNTSVFTTAAETMSADVVVKCTGTSGSSATNDVVQEGMQVIKEP